jgi:hypothetical protein
MHMLAQIFAVSADLLIQPPGPYSKEHIDFSYLDYCTVFIFPKVSVQEIVYQMDSVDLCTLYESKCPHNKAL